MRIIAMMLKFFILAFVLNINCHQANAKSLSESSDHDLLLDNLPTGGHNIAKRDAVGASVSMATSIAKQATMSDVKLITKLIFTRLKKNFKEARANSKGKTWNQFLGALLKAASSAVSGAITEFMVMKTKQKLQSYAGNYLGTIGSMFG